MKHFIKAAILLGLFLLLVPQSEIVQAYFPVDGSDEVNSSDEDCPPVQNTPSFMIVYGTLTLNGSAAPSGSLVKAYSPRNELVGCFSVSSAGYYGTMYIYGEDKSVSPNIPGMRTNEVVSFTIDDLPATSTPALYWINDKDGLHPANLASVGISANFIATPLSGVAPLSVQFTDTSSGSITSWQWNFGDGQSSTERNPLHTYTTPGTYTVVLAVSGSSGADTVTRINYISIYTAANASFVANRVSGIAPVEVAFTNLSSGDFTSSNWTFGDGTTSTQTNPTHTYTTGGTYMVSLTVSGPGGSDNETKTGYITVYSPVMAEFLFSPESGNEPLKVTFTNTSSGDFDSSSWDFGDGTPTSSKTNPIHTFSTSGTYTVTLTISGNGGQDIQSHKVTVNKAIRSTFLFLPFVIR